MFHLLSSRGQDHKLYRYRSIIFHKSPFHLSSALPQCSAARPHSIRRRDEGRKNFFPSVSIYFLIIDILFKVFCIHKYFNGNFHNDINLFLKCVLSEISPSSSAMLAFILDLFSIRKRMDTSKKEKKIPKTSGKSAGNEYYSIAPEGENPIFQ